MDAVESISDYFSGVLAIVNEMKKDNKCLNGDNKFLHSLTSILDILLFKERSSEI